MNVRRLLWINLLTAASVFGQATAELKLCESVANYDPVGVRTTFKAGERAYAWIRINNGKPGQNFKVQWFRENNAEYSWTFSIANPTQRTYTYKGVGTAGKWRVDVKTAEGVVLQSVSFDVTADPAAVSSAGKPVVSGQSTGNSNEIFAAAGDFTKTKILPARDKFQDEIATWFGTPYGWGKAIKQKAVDCSGFSTSVYRNTVGLLLPRSSYEIWGANVGMTIEDFDELEFGDLMFYKGPDGKVYHVSIFISEDSIAHTYVGAGPTYTPMEQWMAADFCGGKRFVDFGGTAKVTDAQLPVVKKDAFLKEMKEWSGTPYKAGQSAKKKGADAMGFVAGAYQTLTGTKLPVTNPRTLYAYFKTAKADKPSELQAGDLCFFKYYEENVTYGLGFYLGDKKIAMFDDGGKIQISALPDSEDALWWNFVGAKRVFNFGDLTLRSPALTTVVTAPAPAELFSKSAPVSKFRVSRPTYQLSKVTDFYVQGLGMKKIEGYEKRGSYNGIILGMPGWEYHLEFTQKKSKEKKLPPPSRDNLLVFFMNDAAAMDGIVARLDKLGYKPVEPKNPYWKERGVTFEDPDGWRVVLMREDMRTE